MISQSQVRKASVDPAANNELLVTVPVGASWELKAVSVSLAQGSTQTPQPILYIDDGIDGEIVFASFGASAAQAVSTTCRYTWAPGLSLSAIVGTTTDCYAVAPLPHGLMLNEKWRIRTNTLGKGANTDYGVASLVIVEYGQGSEIFMEWSPAREVDEVQPITVG